MVMSRCGVREHAACVILPLYTLHLCQTTCCCVGAIPRWLLSFFFENEILKGSALLVERQLKLLLH